MAIHPVRRRYVSHGAASPSRATQAKRRSSRQRRRSELNVHFRRIIEMSNDGICITDSAERMTFVNARMTELLGFSAAEMIGKSLLEFTHGAAEAVGISHELRPSEWCFRRNDGSPVWAGLSRESIAAGGPAMGAIVTITDATQRRRAQFELAASERHYRTVAEAMPHGVYTADQTGSIDYCNRAWRDYTGLSEEQVRSGAWDSLLHPDDQKPCKSAWVRAIRNGEPFEAQFRLRRASDGAYRWFVSRATPIADQTGAVVKWIGSCADIHDFKIASETRSVLDTLGHIISIRNDDGNLEYVSPSFANYSGTAAGAGAHPDWREFVHPADLEILDGDDRASGCDSALGVRQNEIRLRAADGGYRWFLARTVALAQAAGAPKYRLDTLTDIDDLKRAQAAFGQTENRFRALTDAMPQLVWIVDEHTNIEYVNERWLVYTGLPFDPGGPSKVASTVHPDDLVAFAAGVADMLAQKDPECEVRMRRHDGVYRWHLLRTVSLRNVADSTLKWIVTATDFEARKSAETALAHSAAELTYRAHHDPLTNLPNRTKLMDRLGEMIVDAQRDGTSVVVMYLDIDHFKTINDTLGHNAGDKLLVETAARITSALRADDTASRFGGDEFVVVCAAGSEEAAQIAERLQTAARAPIELDGKRVMLASSMGVSVFPDDGSEAADLIQKADAAMYSAKQSGRNAWCLYNAQTRRPAAPAIELEIELREAIAQEQFIVYYQPIINLDSGRMTGAEALVRWAHPERGMLPPSEFIPFAEDHGLIAPIGELVLHAACAQLRRLNLRANDNFSISVNVSARQFQRPGFVATIASAIAAHALDAWRLEIEITESVVMGDTAAVVATLDKLDALGVKLSIDDFGTGYSSLAYLKTFPIHTLKIDRSFVTDIATNFTDQAIAKTIVTLGHSLGMRVIAEGVETSEQLEQLRLLGTDCFQGYLASRPLSPGDFEAFSAGRRLNVKQLV